MWKTSKSIATTLSVTNLQIKWTAMGDADKTAVKKNYIYII